MTPSAPEIETSPGFARLTMRVRPAPYALAIGLIFTFIWLAALVYLPYLALTNRPSVPAYVFLGLGWVVIGIAGAYVAYGTAWSLVGREVLVVEDGRMSVSYAFLGRTMGREFPLAEVADLRVDEAGDPNKDSFGPRMPEGTIGEGPVAFDHDGITYRTGRGLSAEEASKAVEALRRAMDPQREGAG